MSNSVVVFYATREGHTLLVADHIAASLRRRGLTVDMYNVAALDGPIDWSRYVTGIVAASVHVGRHEREMVAFVTQHARDLERIHAVFVSVSLSQAGAENPSAPEDRRRESAADARRMIDWFVERTEWRPRKAVPVAGALAYRRYNPIVRFVMRRIARSAGAPTDTSRNYEFTDWSALDSFVGDSIDTARLRPAMVEPDRVGAAAR